VNTERPPTRCPVLSWNEWDPLREIIVGSARGAAEVAYEPALSPYLPAGTPTSGFAADRSTRR